MATKKAKTVFVCQECGFESAQWMGKCICGAWNSFVEEKILPEPAGGAGGFSFSLCHDGYLFSVRMNKITISHILIIVYPAEEKGLQKGSDHAMIA